MTGNQDLSSVVESEHLSVTLSSPDLATLTELFGTLKLIEASSVELVISFDSGARLTLPMKERLTVSIEDGSASAETSSEKTELSSTDVPPPHFNHVGSINTSPEGSKRWECTCGARGKWLRVPNFTTGDLFKRHVVGLPYWQWDE